MNLPERPNIRNGLMNGRLASVYMDALEAKVAALEAQNAQAYNAGVEAAAFDVEHSIAEGVPPQYFSKYIRARKRPVVEAQNAQELASLKDNYDYWKSRCQSKEAELKQQNAQEFNAGVEAAALYLDKFRSESRPLDTTARIIRALKRPVVEAQKEGL